MGWIGVQTLPLTERKADLSWVLYGGEDIEGNYKRSHKLDAKNIGKWRQRTTNGLESD